MYLRLFAGGYDGVYSPIWGLFILWPVGLLSAPDRPFTAVCFAPPGPPVRRRGSVFVFVLVRGDTV